MVGYVRPKVGDAFGSSTLFSLSLNLYQRPDTLLSHRYLDMV